MVPNTKIIYINIDLFNGTQDDLYLRQIDGHIAVSKKDKSENEKKLGNLILPRFAEHRINQIPAFGNFSFILAQEIPSRLNGLNDGKYIFDFEKLNIMVQSSLDENKVARLPLWDAVELERKEQQIITSRIEYLRADKPMRMIWQ